MKGLVDIHPSLGRTDQPIADRFGPEVDKTPQIHSPCKRLADHEPPQPTSPPTDNEMASALESADANDGEIQYIQLLQKWGIAAGGARTPQNAMTNEKSVGTRRLANTALGLTAAIACPKET